MGDSNAARNNIAKQVVVSFSFFVFENTFCHLLDTSVVVFAFIKMYLLLIVNLSYCKFDIGT